MLSKINMQVVLRRKALLAYFRQLIVERTQTDLEDFMMDPDAPLFGNCLGLDSLDAVEIVVALEADFGIADPDADLLRAAMRSLNTLIDFVIVWEANHGSA